ncbi:hypothetical protein [Rhodoligotrophos defluvii]|uniref:hypothetical protein n=1 Tax=Rhodoligotrophos defluvii TaxID=2561934 RepID=UPI00148584AF|nr:hypothetical protein [Rhodoligotrophos defluvii]
MKGDQILSLLRRLRVISSRCVAGVLFVVAAPAVFASAALAQSNAQPEAASARTLEVELNRLEQREGACRLSMVYRNRLGADIEALQLEAVLFDGDQRVERFLVFSSKALPAGKIRVQQFDIQGLECASVGSVLINDVKACQGTGLEPAQCLAALSLSSRADTKLMSSVDQ